MAENRPVGVLFVHGIGNAAQGETLLGYSEPLFQWIKNWIEKNYPTTSVSMSTDENVSFVRILDVDLRPSDGSPAHSEWLVRLKQENNEVKESQWLLAESWWTDTFTPSNWSQATRWAMQVAPSMVLLHFTTLIRKTVRRRPVNCLVYYLSLALVPVHVFLALLLALIVEVLALILIILAILPIKPIRTFVAKIQFIISNWVGDIYLRITSPVQRAAMVSRVKRDLNWLTARCEKVVVVAHSQGSAIVYEIFQAKKPDNVKRFVTLGTAIRLLRVIEIESPWWFYAIIFLVNFLLPVLALVALMFGPGWWQTITDFYEPGRGFLSMDSLIVSAGVITMFSFLGLVIVEIGKGLYKRASQSPVESEVTFGSDKGFEWIDLFASHDPASYGGLGSKLPKFIKSQEVYNHANIITDHTTYWENMDEFVTQITHIINELAGIGFTTLTYEVVHQAKSRRKWRVVSLIWLRYIVLICSSVTLWTAITYNHISTIGEGVGKSITTILENLPITIVPQDTLTWFQTYDPAIISLGGILLLSVPLLWYRAATWVWSLWGKIELGKLFRGETQNHNEVDFGGGAFVVFVTFALGLLIATVGYYLFSSRDIAVLRPQISAILASIFCSLLISVVFFGYLDKYTWHVKALRVALITAVFITIFHRPTERGNVETTTFLIGLALPVALVWLYDRLPRLRFGDGVSITHWLMKLRNSVSVESEESDENLEKLSAFAIQTSYYVQSILVFAAGLFALGFALTPPAKWNQWMNEIGMCVFGALLMVGMLFYNSVSSKVANHRFLRTVVYLGLIMLLLSCLVLTYMAFTA